MPEDGEQERRIDVPAREERAHRALSLRLAREQRSDPDGAGAFDEELRALEQERDRLADLLVGHLDDLVERLLEDAHRQRARLLDCDPVRDRVAAAAHLDADEPQLRAQRTERDRDPGSQPAAADGDQHRLRVRHLLGKLEPDRSLAGDHALVLERVHEGRSGLLDAPHRRCERLLEAGADEDLLGAVADRRLDLRHRRVLRHEDRRVHAELARRPRDRLAVVAGTRSDDARRALFG